MTAESKQERRRQIEERKRLLLSFEKAPELLGLERRLKELGSMGVVLCGSGPALLGIFADAAEAQAGLRRVAKGARQNTRLATVVSAL